MFIGKMAAFISGLESNSGHCDEEHWTEKMRLCVS